LGHAGENETPNGEIGSTAAPPVTASDFERFLDITLGAEGTTVSTVEAYFNDSGTHPTSPVVCVAGYIFGKEQAIKFDREWRAVLSIYHLPFFRMSSCAHGAEPFDSLSPDKRADLERNMIAVINKWMSYGVAITVEPEMLTRVMPGGGDSAESPFSYCARLVLTSARRWIDQQKVTGDCAYIFESGHRSHGEANDIMNRMYLDARQRKAHRYLSHMFIGKSVATPLQAADLLAWYWYADRRSKTRGDAAPRPGARALFEGGRHSDYSLLHSDELVIRSSADERRTNSQ
jgi:hypothetical protein